VTAFRNPVHHRLKRARSKTKTVRVGIDTGGTFTDFVYQTARHLRIFKVASTPDDPSRAIAGDCKELPTKGGAITIEKWSVGPQWAPTHCCKDAARAPRWSRLRDLKT
jgi:hypothetical protein